MFCDNRKSLGSTPVWYSSRSVATIGFGASQERTLIVSQWMKLGLIVLVLESVHNKAVYVGHELEEWQCYWIRCLLERVTKGGPRAETQSSMS